jgi:hypothetical protein
MFKTDGSNMISHEAWIRTPNSHRIQGQFDPRSDGLQNGVLYQKLLNICYTMSSSPRPSLLPFHQSVGIISVIEMLKIIYGKYCIENCIQSKRMWSVVCSFFTDYFICNSSSTNYQKSYLQFIRNQVRKNQISVQQVIASHRQALSISIFFILVWSDFFLFKNLHWSDLLDLSDNRKKNSI